VGQALPAGQDHHSVAAMRVLYAEVLKLPTILECTPEILQVIQGFKFLVHWHGTDGKWLKSLGTQTPVIDLGKIYNRCLLPVRQCMKASKERWGATQAIASLVLGGKWRNPHFSENDALMLRDCFEGLATLVA
jgi:hypothetical protein